MVRRKVRQCRETQRRTFWFFILLERWAVKENWLKNRNTIEFLGVWESLQNPNFNRVQFEAVKTEAGLNRFVMTLSRQHSRLCLNKPTFGTCQPWKLQRNSDSAKHRTRPPSWTSQPNCLKTIEDDFIVRYSNKQFVIRGLENIYKKVGKSFCWY